MVITSYSFFTLEYIHKCGYTKSISIEINHVLHLQKDVIYNGSYYENTGLFKK